jgi:long-chain acyl-CoA synthetase
MLQLGGRLRVAICGGAPLSHAIAQTFIGLGLPLIQGYGLTEASPIISGNPPNDNIPDSVGVPLRGIEIKVDGRGELLTRSDCVMLGYWNNPEATREMIDADGWLHTGDLVRIEGDHIFITGRLKEIIVLANGEKVAPADMEMAITADPLFEQVLVLGEGKPYLCALVVPNAEHWQALKSASGIDPADPDTITAKKEESLLLERIAKLTEGFPGYAQVRRVGVTAAPWTIEEGLITSTLKLRRARILSNFDGLVRQLYAGH